MRIETAFITDDEKVFFDKREAIKHLDKQYGNEIEKLSHRLLKIEKYAEMINFLDGHLSEFSNAIALKTEINAAQKENNQ